MPETGASLTFPLLIHRGAMDRTWRARGVWRRRWTTACSISVYRGNARCNQSFRHDVMCATQDLARTWRVAEALDYGMIGCNETSITDPAAPFGGIKESGLGREQSKYGIAEFLEVRRPVRHTQGP